MGWIFCIATLIAGLVMKSDAMIVASGLFAIAGSIAFAFVKLKIVIEKTKE